MRAETIPLKYYQTFQQRVLELFIEALQVPVAANFKDFKLDSWSRSARAASRCTPQADLCPQDHSLSKYLAKSESRLVTKGFLDEADPLLLVRSRPDIPELSSAGWDPRATAPLSVLSRDGCNVINHCDLCICMAQMCTSIAF